MNKTDIEIRIERIERFLREQMSPEENKAFLKDLKTDSKLREDAKMMAALIKTMRQTKEREEEHVIRCVRHAERSGQRAVACSFNQESVLDTICCYQAPSSGILPTNEYCQTENDPAMKAEAPSVAEQKTLPQSEMNPVTDSNEKHIKRSGGFMKWTLSIAAMAILVLGTFIFFKKNHHSDYAPNNVIVENTKTQVNKQIEKAKPERILAERKHLQRLTAAKANAEAEAIMDGGTLPPVGNIKDPDVEMLLANIDKAIDNKDDLTPFINEMQDILEGIKNGKEEYAHFQPYKERIDWRLTAALAIDGEGCLAKDVLDEMADEDNVLADMLRKQYQCSE